MSYETTVLVTKKSGLRNKIKRMLGVGGYGTKEEYDLGDTNFLSKNSHGYGDKIYIGDDWYTCTVSIIGSENPFIPQYWAKMKKECGCKSPSDSDIHVAMKYSYKTAMELFIDRQKESGVPFCTYVRNNADGSTVFEKDGLFFRVEKRTETFSIKGCIACSKCLGWFVHSRHTSEKSISFDSYFYTEIMDAYREKKSSIDTEEKLSKICSLEG